MNATKKARDLLALQVFYALDHNPAHVVAAGNMLHGKDIADILDRLREMFGYNFHDMYAGDISIRMAIYGYTSPNRYPGRANILYRCDEETWMVLR